MRANLLSLAIGFTFAFFGYSHPVENAAPYTFLSKLAISPDNTCGIVQAGSSNIYTCDAKINPGGCCSQHDYCGTGCQPDFGICSPPTPQPGDTFTCGPTNENTACDPGLCCSQAGYCGNTTDYCGSGCRPTFGVCNPVTIDGRTCGPNFGKKVCGNNQCCSVEGFCGNTSDHCADPGNCLLGYGRCDSDATPAGPSTQNVPRPFKGPLAYTNDIVDCVENNVVALSYDDGPYQYTSQLLDLLKSYGFHATFFISGNNNGKGEIDLTAPYPDLIRRMIAEGHQVASHTWSHYSLSNISHDLRIAQMVKNEMALNNIIGMWPTYMRPPYSECSQASGCWVDMQALGYHRVYFDLDTQDYVNPLTTQIEKSKDIVKRKLAARKATDYLSIQHDIIEQSVTNLSTYYYDMIRQKGWKGVTVGECLGDTDRSNWYRSFSDSGFSDSGLNTSSSLSLVTWQISKANVTASSSSVKTTASGLNSTSNCKMKNGSWCGTLPSFTNKQGCQQAYVCCFGQTVKCMGGGSTNLGVCPEWTQMCFDLNTFCSKCGSEGRCDSANFPG